MTTVTAAGPRRSPSRRLARKVLLAVATLALLTTAALIMLAIAAVTFFRIRRLYSEILAKRLSRAILTLWGVRVETHQAEPFPQTQTAYTFNHSSTR